MGPITNPYSVRWRVGPMVDMRTWRCGKASGLAQGYMGNTWWKIHFYLTPKWEWGLDRARLMRWACVCVWGVGWGHPNTKPLPLTSYHTDCGRLSGCKIPSGFLGPTQTLWIRIFDESAFQKPSKGVLCMLQGKKHCSVKLLYHCPGKRPLEGLFGLESWSPSWHSFLSQTCL